MALPEKPRPGTLNGIQALRGIAACMVVVCHATLFWARIASPVPVGDPPNFWFSGGAGVDIFFIISGFVMAVSTIGRDLGPHPALIFLKRRFIRVFPLYWGITALFAAEFLLLLHFPHWQTHGEVYNPLTKRFILSSVFLIPRNEIPLLGVAWTLIYECFFYLLFALALALRLAPARLLTPLMLALVLLGTTHFVSGPGTVVITNELLLEFLAGVFLGMAVLAQKKLNVSLSAVLGLIGIVFLLLPRHNLSPAASSSGESPPPLSSWLPSSSKTTSANSGPNSSFCSATPLTPSTSFTCLAFTSCSESLKLSGLPVSESSDGRTNG